MSVLLLSGCGRSAQSASPTTKSDISAFSALFRDAGLQVDYERLATVKEAAAISDLVAEGVLVSVDEGRSLIVEADDPSLDVPSVVVGVRLGEVHQGSLGDTSDGIEYIELPQDARTSVEAYRKALPKGTEVAVYLTLLPQKDPLYRDDAAGRPPGQRIWVPISPQGLVLADGAQSLELLSGIHFDAPLSAFLPPSTSFPQPGSAGS